MRFPCDTHVHTGRCGHAVGGDVEYVEAAIAAGLDAIAFTDHLPMYWLGAGQIDPGLAMAMEELPRYVDAVLSLRDRYAGQLEVLLGVEADFIPGHEATLARLLGSYPFDVVLGSVHHLGDFWVDAPSSRPRYEQGEAEVEAIWRRYAELIIEAASSRMFDVLAHLDLPKKYGFRAAAPFAGLQSEVVGAVAASGCAVELSSAGRRFPAGESYPAPEVVALLASAGVPFVLSSDAHAPELVGEGFAELVAGARAVGIKAVAVFRHRQATLQPL